MYSRHCTSHLYVMFIKQITANTLIEKWKRDLIPLFIAVVAVCELSSVHPSHVTWKRSTLLWQPPLSIFLDSLLFHCGCAQVLVFHSKLRAILSISAYIKFQLWDLRWLLPELHIHTVLIWVQRNPNWRGTAGSGVCICLLTSASESDISTHCFPYCIFLFLRVIFIILTHCFFSLTSCAFTYWI